MTNDTIETSTEEFGTAPVPDIKRAQPAQDCAAPAPPDIYGRAVKASSEERSTIITDPTQWTHCGPDSYIACGTTRAELPAGAYAIECSPAGIFFAKRDLRVDNLIRFKDSQNDAILKEIEGFWPLKQTFAQWGFLHRRGYLTYGPPGSGKTCLVQQVVADIIQRGGLVIIAGHPGILSSGLAILRRVEPERPIVCLFEDIDSMIARFGEPEILAVLDGESQINGVLNVATTNYPELLDRRIVRRPRRFDRVVKIGMPGEGMRRQYFTLKLQDHVEGEVDQYVAATDGFSFAAMAELIISVKCLQNTFEDSIATLKELMGAKPSSSDFDERAGFQPRAGFGNGSSNGHRKEVDRVMPATPAPVTPAIEKALAKLDAGVQSGIIGMDAAIEKAQVLIQHPGLIQQEIERARDK